MTILFTLLAFFIDEKPTPETPPATSGAITLEADLVDANELETLLHVPPKTPATRQLSPSWMVASPPMTPPAPFDVFAPAVRPPHEFPALFACPPVSLVPCPSPRAYEEPAVRHVSYFSDDAKAGAACVDSPCQQYSCPQSPCQQSCPTPGKKPVAFAQPNYGQPIWENAHAAKQAFVPTKYHPPHYQPVPPHHPPHLAGICPVAFPHPVVAGGGPHLPGAKHVQHIVRATYEVTPQTAEALAPFLTSNSGVFGYQIEGEELTINAAAHTQAAIAQFLAVMAPVQQTVSQPKPCVSVNYTAASCCNGKCQCKAEGECKCQCCCGKKAPIQGVPSASTTTTLKAERIFVRVPNCQSAPACNTATNGSVAIDWKPSQSKSIQVKIEATSKGVVMQTSAGTQVRAKAIRLDTSDINKLEVHQADAVFTLPQIQQPEHQSDSQPIIAY